MKIWLCILSLFCWANIAFAQAAADYPDVPLDDPAYQELNVLHDAGVVERWGVGASSYRTKTRYEFAVGIARTLGSIIGNATTPVSAEQINLLRKSPAAIAALARLVEQFSPELQQLGFSQSQLEFVQKELATYRVSTPAEYPDVPLDNPAYTDLYKLDGYGLVPNQPSGMYSHRAYTRYEFAIRVVMMLTNIYDQNDPRPERFYMNEKYRVDKSYRAVFEKHPEVAASFVHLLGEFAPEVAALGLTEMQIKFAQIELSAGRISTLWDSSRSTPIAKPAIPTPFPDVPKTHWAFDAVERLRQSGIVAGYPSGTFSN